LRDRGDLGVLRPHRRLGKRLEPRLRVAIQPSAGRDQPAHDDVLLETPQVVHLAADGRLGEDSRGLLEGCRRDEAVRRQGGLGDPEEDGLGRGPPAAATLSFSSWNTNRSTSSPTTKSVSPTSSIRTRRSIWRTMISMCLSLMVTPCRRYTSCTSLTRYRCSSRSPSTAR